MATLPLQNKISQSSKHSISEKVLTVSYGDGFEQRTVIGNNQQADRWTISYNVIDNTQRDTLLDFYRSVGKHNSFTWTAYGDSVEKKWIMSGDFSETALSGDFYKISFGIHQVFDLL